jgi:hypothetical protein
MIDKDHPPLHQLERISRVKNRMRESRSSGSVGGEGGNLLAYPAPISDANCASQQSKPGPARNI